MSVRKKSPCGVVDVFWSRFLREEPVDVFWSRLLREEPGIVFWNIHLWRNRTSWEEKGTEMRV